MDSVPGSYHVSLYQLNGNSISSGGEICKALNKMPKMKAVESLKAGASPRKSPRRKVD